MAKAVISSKDSVSADNGNPKEWAETRDTVELTDCKTKRYVIYHSFKC